MSNWIEPKRKDLSISDDGNEIEIYIGYFDYGGANYVTVKLKDIRELAKEYVENKQHLTDK